MNDDHVASAPNGGGVPEAAGTTEADKHDQATKQSTGMVTVSDNLTEEQEHVCFDSDILREESLSDVFLQLTLSFL